MILAWASPFNVSDQWLSDKFPMVCWAAVTLDVDMIGWMTIKAS